MTLPSLISVGANVCVCVCKPKELEASTTRSFFVKSIRGTQNETVKGVGVSFFSSLVSILAIQLTNLPKFVCVCLNLLPPELSHNKYVCNFFFVSFR